MVRLHNFNNDSLSLGLRVRTNARAHGEQRDDPWTFQGLAGVTRKVDVGFLDTRLEHLVLVELVFESTRFDMLLLLVI